MGCVLKVSPQKQEVSEKSEEKAVERLVSQISGGCRAEGQSTAGLGPAAERASSPLESVFLLCAHRQICKGSFRDIFL